MQELKAVEGRVVVSIDHQYKNEVAFNGGTINLLRHMNNLDRTYTQPVNAIVLDCPYIPKGSEILVHHNAMQDTYRIFNYKQIGGEDAASEVKYYSIPEGFCFIWKDENNTWQPIKPFETALRIFIPYKGFIQGIDHTKIADTLFVTSGELNGKAVKTLKSCDYCITFKDINGKDGRVIRFRPYGDEREKRDEEAIAIIHEITDKILSDEYLIGIDISDAKKYSEYGRV